MSTWWQTERENWQPLHSLAMFSRIPVIETLQRLTLQLLVDWKQFFVWSPRQYQFRSHSSVLYYVIIGFIVKKHSLAKSNFEILTPSEPIMRAIIENMISPEYGPPKRSKDPPKNYRQGTSPRYQYCCLDLVIWYWDKCRSVGGGARKVLAK